MRNIIVFLAAVLLIGAPAQAATTTGTPGYGVVLVNSEEEFQAALKSFMEGKQHQLAGDSISQPRAINYPLLFVDPRYKPFGDGEAAYWMIPIGSQDKMIFNRGKITDSALEISFLLKFNSGYPFMMEFHTLDGATLRFVPQKGHGKVETAKVSHSENASGYRKTYHEPGTLTITMPLEPQQ